MQNQKRTGAYLNNVTADKTIRQSALGLNSQILNLLEQEEQKHDMRLKRLRQLQERCNQIQAGLDELKSETKQQ